VRHTAPPAPLPALPAASRIAPQAAPRLVQPSPVHAEYARRPASPSAPTPRQAPLDPHGRAAPAPVARNSEDDHLEIPAFLRRQSS
jgi:cell division protein FtsZ